MNDIEIIKQVIYTEQGKKMSYIDVDNVIDNECENFIQAIENLIQRNKDLEQIEKEHKEENGRLRDKIKELEEIDLTTVYMDGIYNERDKWKIKVKKKIEEIIQNSSHFNMISPLNYDKEYYETRFAVDKLQELLEESEK